MRGANLTVTACNLNYPHDMEYLLDLPDGEPDRYVFIHFLSPFEIYTQQGIQQGGVNDCILYAPGFKQWNRGVEIPLVNNWMHIEGADAGAFFQDLGIPQNELFPVTDSGFIEPAIAAMRREIYEQRPAFEQMLSLRVQEFYIELHRRLHEHDTLRLSSAEAAHLPAFRRLRHNLLGNFTRNWRVSDMAAEIHLSRSRFSVLYARIFGLPPLEDLLRMRLEHACALLTDSNMTVERIADECGFCSSIHFHRIFRKRMGMTPRAYAQMTIQTSRLNKARSYHHHL